MCYAIIEVQFSTPGTPIEKIDVPTKEALETRLAALQASDGAERITIFRPIRKLQRQPQWIESDD